MTIRLNGAWEAERVAAAVQTACVEHDFHVAWGADVANRIRQQAQAYRERNYRRKLRDWEKAK